MSDVNPSSQAPEPQQTFGSAPQPQQTFGTAEPPAPAPESGGRSKFKGLLFRAGGAVLVLIIVSAVGWFFSRDDADNAKVGDCFEASVMSEVMTDATNEKTVDCTKDSAKYKVVGIVENKKANEMNPDADCAAFTTAVAAIWLGPKDGGTGKVYCVEDVKK